MLLQSLVSIAAMLVLAGSILLETLVSAKAAFHQAMLAKTQTALADATGSFLRWTQERVATYGAADATAWPGQTAPIQDPNVCPNPAAPGSTPSPCPFAAFDSWQIRGATTSDGSPPASPAPGVPDAKNLAPTVNEQRLAATITVRITDPTGRTTFADRTREVTARIFEAPPYVVITGTRDITAEAGSIHAGEGDTAGTAQLGVIDGKNFGTPNPNYPSLETDTRIRTSVDCRNRPNFDQRSDGEAAANGEIDYSFHPYGNQDWAYEAACVPPSGAPTPAATLPGYLPPDGTTYSTAPGSRFDTNWKTGTENYQTFAR